MKILAIMLYAAVFILTFQSLAAKSKKIPDRAELIFKKADVVHIYRIEEDPKNKKRKNFIFIDEKGTQKVKSILLEKAKDIKNQWGEILYEANKSNEEKKNVECIPYVELKIDDKEEIVCQNDTKSVDRVFTMLHRYYKQFEK